MKQFGGIGGLRQEAGMLQQIVKASQSGADRIKVQNALNPLLWLCAIATPMCLAAAYFFIHVNAPPAFCWLLLVAAAAPIFIASCAFVGFAIFSPERLQSEAYQLQHEALKLIEKSGTPLRISPVSIEAITTLTAKQQVGG